MQALLTMACNCKGHNWQSPCNCRGHNISCHCNCRGHNILCCCNCRGHNLLSLVTCRDNGHLGKCHWHLIWPLFFGLIHCLIRANLTAFLDLADLGLIWADLGWSVASLLPPDQWSGFLCAWSGWWLCNLPCCQLGVAVTSMCTHRCGPIGMILVWSGVPLRGNQKVY